MVCKWLEHISEVTGESVETLIANGIYHHISGLEGDAYKAFSMQEPT